MALIVLALAEIFVDVLEAGAAYEAASSLGIEMAEAAVVEGESVAFATEGASAETVVSSAETTLAGTEGQTLGDFSTSQAAAHAQLESWGISGAMQTRVAGGARFMVDNSLQITALSGAEMGGMYASGHDHLGMSNMHQPFGVMARPPKRPGQPLAPDPKVPRGGGGHNPKRPGSGGGGTPNRPRGGGGGNPKRPAPGGSGGGGGGGRPPTPPQTPKRPEGHPHRAPWGPGDNHDVFGASKIKSKSSENTDFGSMPRNPTGISKTTTRTHRFCTNNGTLTKALNIATNDSYIVKANSIIEPVGADAGARNNPDGDTSHDVMLFDQFAAIYNLFTVRRCRIRVDFSNADHSADVAASISDGVIVGIALVDAPANLTEPGHYQELADTKWRVLGPEGVATMTHMVDVGKWFGVPKVMSDDTLRLSTTAGTGDIDAGVPSQALFWHIFFHATRRGGPVDAQGITIDLTVTCDYDVTWSEPKAVAQS